jgi:hypothetical protein
MDLLSLFDPGVFNTAYGKRLLYLNRSEGGIFEALDVDETPSASEAPVGERGTAGNGLVTSGTRGRNVVSEST